MCHEIAFKPQVFLWLRMKEIFGHDFLLLNTILRKRIFMFKAFVILSYIQCDDYF